MSPDQIRERIYSVDLLRGVVMMLMLLDHTRDFVQAGALQSDPTDLSKGDALLFFTRWITHFCAPTFVLLSGVSIYLQKLNGKPTGELAKFLFTRGLWLVIAELTVVRIGFLFNVDYSFLAVIQVIWVIGGSMMIMAVLVYLPVRIVGLGGVLMIVAHNLLDRFQVPPNVAFASSPPPDIWQSVWLVLHQPGVVPIAGGITTAFIAYPLIPWIGVMMAGYWLGTVYRWEADQRRTFLWSVGAAITVLFFALRLTNLYGDPVIWSQQENWRFTLLSILNTTKYPPSLLYLMMTLGPALLVLAAADRISGSSIWVRIAITFGRVPMFYYLLQFPMAHGMGVILSYFAGKDTGYLFMNFPENASAAPPDHGFSLGVVYAAWLAGLALLYPLCLWYGNYKRRNKHWVLSYL